MEIKISGAFNAAIFFSMIVLFNMRKIHSYKDDSSKQHSAHNAAALSMKLGGYL
jgi:hypothetical protein